MQPAWVAWLVSGVLALFGGWIIITNYWITIRWYRHRRTASHTPLLGGLCLMAALLASPIPRVARYAWVPFVYRLGVSGYGPGIPLRRGVEANTQEMKRTPPNRRLAVPFREST